MAMLDLRRPLSRWDVENLKYLQIFAGLLLFFKYLHRRLKVCSMPSAKKMICNYLATDQAQMNGL